jgi:quinoprotein glucose dehydrogenase
VLDSLRRFRFGPIFTPPSIQGTLVMPGWVGGAPWGGGAFEPESGTFYVRANNMPVLARLKPVPPPLGESGPHYVVDYPGIELRVRLAPEPRRFEAARSRLGRRAGPGLLVPIGKPPYGTMTAIDLATGEHRWQVRVGDMPRIRFHRRFRHLRLPPLGTPGTAGSIVTGGGLLFVPAGPTLVALDARSGRELWQGRLPWQGYGTPMTYRADGGRQFVVVATGGLGGELVAFALTGV